jgi:hypothetical protein
MVLQTKIVYMHYHHKSLEKHKRMSRQKLAPFVNVDDQEALKNFNGIGYHLVGSINRSSQEYAEIMKPNDFTIEFEAFCLQLENLDIDRRFCEF